MTSRIANLGSLSNIPKANADYNKRLCIVFGDICTLSTDVIVVPYRSCELRARVSALAGEKLKEKLDSTQITMGDAEDTPAFDMQKDGFPSHLIFCNSPDSESPQSA